MAFAFAFLQIDGICFVRVHSLSMSRSQDLALLPRCCRISVSSTSSMFRVGLAYTAEPYFLWGISAIHSIYGWSAVFRSYVRLLQTDDVVAMGKGRHNLSLGL